LGPRATPRLKFANAATTVPITPAMAHAGTTPAGSTFATAAGIVTDIVRRLASPSPIRRPTMDDACKHCRNGFFYRGSGFYFGQDVECVNGVLIDIDEAHEGPAMDVIRPVAPCHPMWAKQQADPYGDWPNDSIERLEAWRDLGRPPIDSDGDQEADHAG
jgi:hypothetical protein